MRIIRLQSENFKRLVAVDITPEGDLVELRGNNENGKSSVLDAIFAALGGAKAAPEKPVREGEEVAVIRLDLGDYIVTRYFTAEGTTQLKVTNPEGASFSEAQTTLNKLVGHISFDPLAFRDLKPEEQAAELSQLVEIVDPDTGEAIDLGKMAAEIKALFDERTIINREGKALNARLEGMAIAHVPDDAPNREELVAKLAGAAEYNSDIERRRNRILEIERQATQCENYAANAKRRADELREEIARAEAAAKEQEDEAARLRMEAPDIDELPEPVDVSALTAALSDADRIENNRRHNAERERLIGERDGLLAKSKSKSEAMKAIHERRTKAIAAAKMPVEGLALQLVEDKLAVVYNGIPFSQASDAVRLRVSAGVAMAANPKLRIIRLKDASLLDKAAVETLREMATANDFQIWAEFVGDEGTGIIMEAGQVRGADTPEPMEKPKTRKPKPAEVETDKAETSTVPTGATETEKSPNPSTGEEKAGELTRNASNNDAACENAASPSTLFERMSDDKTPSKPKAMRSFTTKPRSN